LQIVDVIFEILDIRFRRPQASLQNAEVGVYGGDGDVVALLRRRDGLLDVLDLRLDCRDLLREACHNIQTCDRVGCHSLS
jgi:hypothetical protein